MVRLGLTEFDLGVLRQQHVLSLDVSVDDLVLVEMSQTLQTQTETGTPPRR